MLPPPRTLSMTIDQDLVICHDELQLCVFRQLFLALVGYLCHVTVSGCAYTAYCCVDVCFHCWLIDLSVSA